MIYTIVTVLVDFMKEYKLRNIRANIMNLCQIKGKGDGRYGFEPQNICISSLYKLHVLYGYIPPCIQKKYVREGANKLSNATETSFAETTTHHEAR